MSALHHNEGLQPPRSSVVIVISEETSHIDILGLFLLLLLWSLRGGGVSSGSGGSGSGSWSSRGEVSEQIVNISILESLGEESGPISLDLVLGSLDNLVQLLGLVTAVNQNLMDLQ